MSLNDPQKGVGDNKSISSGMAYLDRGEVGLDGRVEGHATVVRFIAATQRGEVSFR